MNKFIYKRTIAAAPLLLSLLLLCLSAAPANAQENGQPAPGEAAQNTAAQSDNPLGPLHLTDDQLAKIRNIREQNKDERRMVNERLKNAQFALDEAIYSEDASEAVIEQRARELAQAQAASVRLRALTELSIRRVLTPEQLNTLRAIRQRQAKQRRLERRLNPPRLRNQQPGNNDGQLPLQRAPFRQRENGPAQPNENNNRPADGLRERLRKGRP